MPQTATKSRVTPDHDQVVTEIEIQAPADRVFQALIDHDQALQWGKSEAFEITLWEMEARQGGKWHFISRQREAPDKIFDHHGEILRIDPPRLLEYTWFTNWHPSPDHRTVVRWDLTPTTTGTILKVTHSGLRTLPGVAEGYAQGWPGLIEQIKKFVEK